VSIISKLTPTEMEILLLLCDGLSRQEIAEVRNITFSTVKTHINNMLSKFGLSSSRELVQMLKANNIIEIMKQLNQSQPMNE
ncbi:MAG TPA: helix-turn-helix transcriptional regulator, partial [Cytophagaceae bacterium]